MKGVKKFVKLEKGVLVPSIIMAAVTATFSLWERFLPKLYEGLGASLVIVGFIVSLLTAIRSISPMLGGYLSDRYGRKKSIIFSGYVLLISLALFFLSVNWLVVIFPVILVAFALKTMEVATQTLVADILSPKKRASGLATFYTFVMLPAIITPAIGGLIVESYGMLPGLRIAFIITAVFCSLVFLFTFPQVKETLKNPELGKLKLKKLRLLLNFLKKVPKSLVALICSLSLLAFGGTLVTPFIIFYFLDVVGIGAFKFGTLISVQATISILFLLPFGKISDKIGRKPIILLAHLFWTMAVILILFAKSFWHLLPAFILGGLSLASFPSINAFIADITPKRNRAKMLGIASSLPSISAIPAPAIGGFLYVIGPTFVFITGSILGAIATAIVLTLVRKIS